MPPISERSPSDQIRTYDRASSVVFLKTHEAFGGLSNMAGGFPLHVQGTRIYTSEALYQACRFPHLPEVQRLIIGQASPMTAKMKSKPYRKDSRTDWDRVRVKVMRWCLRVKLAQNWEKFSELLLRTGDRPIVEESRKDDFWGAKPVEEQTLVGINVLGRLLMELREAVRSQGRQALRLVQPPTIPEFLLFGRQIGSIGTHDLAREPEITPMAPAAEGGTVQGQASLFKVPVAREASPSSHGAIETVERKPLSHLKPQPTMMDSGVLWLGKVPTHWAVKPGRACFREKTVPNTGLVETTVLSLSYGRIVVKPAERLHGLVPSSFETYQIVDPGDIVIRPTDLQNDWNSLRFALSRERGIITSAYLCFQTMPELSREYGHLLLHTYDLMKVFYGLGSGLRQNLDWNDFKYLPCLVPPVSEQAAIVRFLEHADRRIRGYIRAKQKLIKMLEEQKQAIAHGAVTRGVDPNLRLKLSGMEWLGDVPEHWRRVRLKDVATVQTGLTLGKNYGSSATSRHPYLRVANVQAGRLDIRIIKTIDVPAAEACRCKLEPGDVLMTEGGDIDKLGRGCVWNGEIPESLHQNHIFAVRCRPCLLPEYLVALMSSGHGRAYFQLTAKQTTNLAATNSSTLRAFPMFIPDVAEQRRILAAVAIDAGSQDRASSDAQQEIALLKEFRTRLIADVVTGKLDVREAAARLPDAVEDQKALDAAEDEPDAQEADAALETMPEEAEA